MIRDEGQDREVLVLWGSKRKLPEPGLNVSVVGELHPVSIFFEEDDGRPYFPRFQRGAPIPQALRRVDGVLIVRAQQVTE